MMIDLKMLADGEGEWGVVVRKDGDGAMTVDRDERTMHWSTAEEAYAAAESADLRERVHATVCAQWFADRMYRSTDRSNPLRPVPKGPVPCPPRKPKAKAPTCWCHSADGQWKRMVATQDEASAIAFDMSVRKGAAMSTFACPSGQGFHVATSVADKRHRAAMRAQDRGDVRR